MKQQANGGSENENIEKYKNTCKEEKNELSDLFIGNCMLVCVPYIVM